MCPAWRLGFTSATAVGVGVVVPASEDSSVGGRRVEVIVVAGDEENVVLSVVIILSLVVGLFVTGEAGSKGDVMVREITRWEERI